jgi:hypothetical protein
MNSKNEFLIENQHRNKEEVKKIVKEYLLGTNPDGKKGPDYINKEIPQIGKAKVSNGMISYMHDLASSKEMINYTLRAIGESCIEIRNEKSQLLFGKEFFDLDEEKQKAVEFAVPIWFSYELPKSPATSFWQPFKNAPTPDPKPINIVVKTNGEIIVEKQKYDSFGAFQENIEEWKKELTKLNEKSKVQHYYRAQLTFEDISREEQEDISYFLFKNNIHVERINQTISKRNLVHLENNKLNQKVETTNSELNKVKDSTMIPPPLVYLKVGKKGEYFVGNVLYPETGNVTKVVAWDKKISLEELQVYLIKKRSDQEKTFKKDNGKYDLVANVDVEVGASEKQISSLKEVLRKAEIQYVNYSSGFKKEGLNSKN